MEKIQIVYQVCTFGVVGCGLTVIIAATIRIIRDIMKAAQPQERPRSETWAQLSPEPQPRQRKRRVQPVEGEAAKPVCEHCGSDITEGHVVRSDIIDTQTFLIKECPSCKKECSIEVK